MQGALVGLVAGLASALLFDAAFTGTPFGVPLFLLTGLPIAIAGFGWGSVSLAIAAVAGAAGVAAFLAWAGVVVFVGVFALPIVWATLLATRPRPTAMGGGWYSAGTILTNATLALALGVIAIGVVIQFDPATLITEAAQGFADLAAQVDPNSVPPTAADYEPGLRVLVPLLPAIAATMALGIVALDLYLGAKAVRFSDLLRRPEEDLSALTLPWPVPVAFVLATAASFVPGNVGYTARVVAGASGLAVALVGLAVVHAVTRRWSARLPLLSALYALTAILSGLMLLLLAALGLAETVFHIRAQRAKPRRPTPTS